MYTFSGISSSKTFTFVIHLTPQIVAVRAVDVTLGKIFN